MRHPNIVDVTDAGDDALGTYLVLERLDGRTLEGILASRRRLSMRDALVLVRQACAAVAAVHDAGVVHRDLKPGNMIVLGPPDGDLGKARVKLIDFGIATEPPATAPRPKLTGEQIVLGTAEYMPFEQLTAQSRPSPTGDTWALGVTLYECLTGRVPFPGTYRDVLRQWMTGRLVPVQEYRPDVPPWLAAFLERALAHDPEERFPDARTMLAALDAAILEAKARLSRPEMPAVSHGRRATRAPYMTPVRVRTATEALDGRSEDVSTGGLFVVLPSSAGVVIGARVEVRFPMPANGALVTCAAIVRWVRPRTGATSCAVGLEFVALDPRIERALEQYVQIVGAEEPAPVAPRGSVGGIAVPQFSGPPSLGPRSRR